MNTWQIFLIGMVCGVAVVLPPLLWFAIKIADCVPRFK
jgi:hypothetical protein